MESRYAAQDSRRIFRSLLWTFLEDGFCEKATRWAKSKDRLTDFSKDSIELPILKFVSHFHITSRVRKRYARKN